MKFLIESFYRSIVGGGCVPIPYREILLTSRIMDSIFDDLDGPIKQNADGRGELRPLDVLGISPAERVDLTATALAGDASN
jgi:hypothetical protein